MSAIIGFLLWCVIPFVISFYTKKMICNWNIIICLFVLILLFVLGFLSTFFFFGLEFNHLEKLPNFFQKSSPADQIGEIVFMIIWVWLFFSGISFSIDKGKKKEVEDSEDMETY